MGFRKAKPQQAYLKFGFYGAQGRGKTATALLCAEYLAKQSGKRVAFVDTEHGTDFYAMDVGDERPWHPEAFDFDALYERSVNNIMGSLKSLKPSEHSVIVIDSMTHIWEVCQSSYRGKRTAAGTLPMHAWGAIKRPYKEMMKWLLDCPFHVFMLGREGYEYGEDEHTGEMKRLGTKMKAEGETAYEPHVLVNLALNQEKEIIATAEKDRTSLLAGKVIKLWPAPQGKERTHTGDSLIKPLLRLLGEEQAQTQSTDDAAAVDAEAQAEAEIQKEKTSKELSRKYKAEMDLADSKDALESVAKKLTPEVKRGMLKEHVDELKTHYVSRSGQL